MLKQIFKRVLPLLLGLACLLGLFLFGPTTADAANPTTINFQGKVVNSNGTNVTDGTYSFIFRIYNTSSPTMTTSCTSTSTCLWQETQSTVTVTSGVFQVELGSACALTSGSCNNSAGGPINFANNSSLYLTMQFNGDTSGSNGGFMSPLIHITSVPFALQSDNSSSLGGLAAANYVQLATGNLQADSTTNNSISVNKTGASGNILLLEANSKAALTVDNSGNLILGQAGASGLAGNLTFHNATDSSTASISFTGNSNANYTYLLPSTVVSSGLCLQSGTLSGGNVPLTFASCSTGGGYATIQDEGSGLTQRTTVNFIGNSVACVDNSGSSRTDCTVAPTLQNAYDNSGSPATITTSSSSKGILFVAGASSNSTSFFQLQNSSGSSGTLFNADTTNMRVGVNVTYATMNTPSSPSATLATQMNTPSVSANGGTGTTYNYIVIAIKSTGNSAASAVGTVSGASSLNTSGNNNVVSWSTFTGATSYNVYRTTGGGTTGFIGNTTSLSFTDTGFTANGVVPTAGGSLTANKTYFYKIAAIDGGGGETSLSTEVSATTAVTANTQQTIDLTWTAPSPSNGVVGYRIYRTNGTLGSGNEDYLTTANGTTFTDDGTITLSSTTPPVSSTLAYTATNNSNNDLQIAVGGNGGNTGQVYVGGTVPTQYLGSASNGLNSGLNVYIQGRYAYVASQSNNSLVIFDVSNPAAPIELSSISNGLNSPFSVYVQGHYAYVTSFSNNSLVIFDVSNPAAPVQIGSTNNGLNGPKSVYVQGRYAYVASFNNSSLLIFDVSNPAVPVVVGGDSAANSNLLSPVGVYSLGRYVYVTDQSTNGLVIFDVSNPAAPVQVGFISTTSIPVSVYVQGRYAYIVTLSGNSLTIIDINNPAAPVQVGSTTSGLSAPRVVYVQGRYAYVASQSNNSLVIFDVSNPAAPVQVGSTTSGLSSPAGLFVDGRYGYVVGGSKLVTFDLGGEYVQQLEAGGAELGTLQVDTNGQVAGDFNIQGGLNLGQSLQIAGNIGDNGSLYVQGGTILSGGKNQLGIPTSLVASAPISGGTLTPNTPFYYKVTAVDANGNETAATSEVCRSIAASGTLREIPLTWSAPSGGTPAAYKIYRSAGTLGSGCTSSNAEFYLTSVTSTSFTDASTIATTGSASAPTTDTTGQLTVLGSGLVKTTSNSATAFQVQNSSGVSVFTADTSNGLVALGNSSLAGQLSVYNGTNAVSLKAASSTASYSIILPATSGTNNYCLADTSTLGTLQWLPCGAGATATVTLSPEYAGAVMTHNNNSANGGTGTMTSDFCSGSSHLGIPASSNPCGSTQDLNYYSWTANATNDYDIWTNWQLPSDWSSFSASPVTFFGWTTSTSDAVKLTVYDNGTACGNSTISLASTLFNSTTVAVGSCTFSAGDKLVFDVDLKVGVNSEFARVSNISITYNRN